MENEGNRIKFMEMMRDHHLGLEGVARILAAKTARPISSVAVSGWLRQVRCPDWALTALVQALQDPRDEMKAVVAAAGRKRRGYVFERRLNELTGKSCERAA